MSETGLNEEEVRSHKKYRKILAEASRKNNKLENSGKKLAIQLIKRACKMTKLARKHPETLAQIKTLVEEHNRKANRYNLWGWDRTKPISYKAVLQYINFKKSNSKKE